MNRVAFSVILLTLHCVPCTAAAADDLPTLAAPQLLPGTMTLYAEIPRPRDLVSTLLDHPLRASLEAHHAVRRFMQTQPWRNFLTGRKFFELQMGMEYREALTAITEGGIFAGLDPVERTAVLLIRGRDAATMETVRQKLLELTRLNQQSAGTADREYRGIAVYRVGDAGAAVVGRWLVFVNQREVGLAILDRLLDAETADDSPAIADSSVLASQPTFAAAAAARPTSSSLWAFLNLEALRADDRLRQKLEGQAANPLAELLAGGLQSTLQHTPYVTAALQLQTSGAQVSLAAPWDAAWIPETRHWYFGPDGSGTAPALPTVPQTLLTLGSWRDVSEMWLRAGDLFDARMNDQLATADSSLTTLFAGRDFGEEILGSFEPQLGLIVTRQDFGDTRPQPAIRLPAFALVLQLREPERMTRELRRTFQSMVGFFNVVGAMEGRPQLEMDMRKLGGAELITSVYLPEDTEQNSTTAPLIFNFSPSVGFAGHRCVIASSQQLAEQLITAPEPATGTGPEANSFVELQLPVLQQILADNREQLISQNMLEEGHTREEAENQMDLLLELLGCFRGAGLTLTRQPQSLQLQLKLDVVTTAP